MLFLGILVDTGWSAKKTRAACAARVVTSSMRWHQSPSVNSDALPPAAVVFTVTVFSVAKRGR